MKILKKKFARNIGQYYFKLYQKMLNCSILGGVLSKKKGDFVNNFMRKSWFKIIDITIEL